ncbi:hypothetical protein KC921_02020 [Candidatus Woesebacteria bacterium]|nr:hypothetical protein [Candidatus Woesebacteria bacterium]
MKTQYKKLLSYLSEADQALVGLSRRLPKALKGLKIEDDLGSLSNILRRLAIVGIVFLVAAIVLWFVIWITYVGPRGQLSNPENQLAVATALPTATPTPNAPSSAWENGGWLNPEEARALRQQPNVINFALLGKDDSVKYSKNLSVEFSATGSDWMRAKPANMTALDVNQSSVRMVADGKDYVLNVLQPFVFADQQQFVWIVDLQGNLWQILSDNVQLDTLENVTSTLPVGLPPNPQLSFSF